MAIGRSGLKCNTKEKEVVGMSKIAVVYWSGTGNTEQMAQLVAQGAQEAGAQAQVIPASAFGADQMDAFDAVAF